MATRLLGVLAAIVAAAGAGLAGGAMADDSLPLTPVVQWAKKTEAKINKDIRDYSAVLEKQERVVGELGKPERVFIKVRHQPFSVYAYVLTPAKKKGREGIYVEGRNDGKLLGHDTGWAGLLGTVPLDPTGPAAMEGHLHSILDTGILHLVQEIKTVAEANVRQTGCTVETFANASINGRKAKCVRVAFPSDAPKVKALLIRVFITADEYELPIRYESYEWPRAKGAEPVPLEQYTYINVRLNPGFTDMDFDVKNENYGFR